MMIVQRDKMSAPSSRELAQRLYDKNVELENRRRRSAQARVPSDPNAWQQMRENYEAIILQDHTFSEQHNIEYALWQLHYRRIEEFRVHFSAASVSTGSTPSQTGKGPTRPDRVTKIRLQFKTFLSEATGFYHDLILKIRAKYGLPIGHFSELSENRIAMEKDGKRLVEMKKGLVSCHRCLIYLGDLARYRGLYGEGDSKSRDYAAASSYYLQAASLWPSSGNPHHQLAILATYSGDELVAVYHYFRSLAVDNPFSTARDNLIVAFEKNRQSYSQLHGDTTASAVKESPARMNTTGRRKVEARLGSKDANIGISSAIEKATSIHETYKAFCIRFVRLNGILFTGSSLEMFGEVLSLVTSALHELLSSGPEEELNFGTDAVDNGLVIVRLISILIFTVHNVKREAEGQSYADILQHTILLQNALIAVFELMGHILNRCEQLSDPSSSYLLHGILVFVEWLASCPDVAAGSGNIDEKQATVRSIFWHNCISFLNKLLYNGLVSIEDKDETCFVNTSSYGEGKTENLFALWEDFELRGFLPLQPAQTILDFSRHSFGGDGNKEIMVRAKRILAAGKTLASIVRVDQKMLRFDLKLNKFVIGVEPQNSDDIMPTPYSGSPKPNGRIQEISTDSITYTQVIQPKAQLYFEGEEDDEVIVFKPTVIERRTDAIASKWTSREGLESGQNAFTDDSNFYGGPVSAPHTNLLQKSAFVAGSQPPVCVADVVSQHLQSYQSHTSMCLSDQQDSLANGLKGLSLLENGHMMKPGMPEDTAMSHSASLSIQQSVNLNTSGISYSSAKASGSMIQPKIDTGASSGGNVLQTKIDTIASSASPPSYIKAPANRPVRHLGPPPGFTSVRPKLVNEPILRSDLAGENPVVDDYNRLDGYQLPSSMKLLGRDQIINHPFYSNPLPGSNGNSSVGTVTFPFPGKQTPAVQFEAKQLQQQQFIPLPDQFEGQTIWTGHHFV